MARNNREKSSLSHHYLFGTFCIVALIVKFVFHEMWKDEWQAWQLATKTESLTQLFSFLPGEGHPSLWFLLLRGWNFITGFLLSFTADWFRIQVLHYLLVIATAFVITYKIHASLWKKIFFLSGYFVLYEYAVMARPYILIVLLTLFCVSSFQKDDANKVEILIRVILLFLLTQVEVYGLFIAIGFLFYSYWKDGSFRINGAHLAYKAVILLGAILFYFQVVPGGAGVVTEGTAPASVFRQFADPFQSLTLNTFIPGMTDTVFKEEPGFVSLVLSGMLLAGILYIFRKQKELMASFIVVFLLFYVFGAFLFLGGVRNWGILCVFFLALLLLKKDSIATWQEYVVLGLIIGAGFIHGFNVMLSDITGKFSNAKDAGEFIVENVPEEVPVIGLNKAFCVPVLGYAGRAFIGMPEKKSYYYFESHDWRGKTYMPTMEELLYMKETLRSRKIVVLYNKPMNPAQYPLLKPLKKFDEPSLRKESYFFYYF